MTPVSHFVMFHLVSSPDIISIPFLVLEFEFFYIMDLTRNLEVEKKLSRFQSRSEDWLG